MVFLLVSICVFFTTRGYCHDKGIREMDSLISNVYPNRRRCIIKKDLWEIDLQIENGYRAGDITYQIGGEVIFNNYERTFVHFPISELKFPFDCFMGSLETHVYYDQKIEGYLDFSKNLNDPSTKMEDSDWLIPNEKTIYSESNAFLETWDLEVGFRKEVNSWQKKNFCLTMALGMGYIYQHTEWEMSNLDQWNPQNSGLEHYYHDDGIIGSYEVQVHMPYIELINIKCTLFHRLHILNRLCFSPYLKVNDQDDHKLRYIFGKTKAYGSGFIFETNAQFDVTQYIFLSTKIKLLEFKAHGVGKKNVYDGEDEGG